VEKRPSWGRPSSYLTHSDDVASSPWKFDHRYFFVVLAEWFIPEPRKCTQSIPRAQMLVLWRKKTENYAKKSAQWLQSYDLWRFRIL